MVRRLVRFLIAFGLVGCWAIGLLGCSSHKSGFGGSSEKEKKLEPIPKSADQQAADATSPSPSAQVSASPEPTVLPTATATPKVTDVIAVDLAGCTRNFECSLQGTKPGQFKALLNVNQPAYEVGQVITMNYSQMRGVEKDWITVVPVDFEDNSWCTWFWANKSSGTYDFNGLPKGTYELRAFYGWATEGECEVIGRKRFEVK